jgi:ABC-2 type transport system ATP-binding protein
MTAPASMAAGRAAPATVACRGLTKRFGGAYGVLALDQLDLDVPAGSVFGLLGPNGAGKTTTLRLVTGLARPTAGAVTIDGRPLGSDGVAAARTIGVLDQEPRYYGWMTGSELVEFAGGLQGLTRTEARSRAKETLERVGLADAARRRVGGYSGGMRQRLGIAQALIGAPAVLLLDEPVSALDPIGRREVLDLMRELRGEVTVFYSTHILEDVERVSDHVAILDGGRLVRSAPTAELLESFDQDQLRVVLGGADDATAVALTELPGVVSVEPAEREGALRTYLVRVQPGATTAVQAAITRFAVDHGLFVTENHLVRLGLEDVFLRLVDTKERAA